MKAQWNLFHGQRTNEGTYLVTVRNGAYVANGECSNTLQEALASAERKFEKQFHSLANSATDISSLLD